MICNLFSKLLLLPLIQKKTLVIELTHRSCIISSLPLPPTTGATTTTTTTTANTTTTATTTTAPATTPATTALIDIHTALHNRWHTAFHIAFHGTIHHRLVHLLVPWSAGKYMIASSIPSQSSSVIIIKLAIITVSAMIGSNCRNDTGLMRARLI